MRKVALFFILLAVCPIFAAKGGDVKKTAVEVEVGRPTIAHRLFYEKMYEKKPFRDAIIYYYDNGIYKIISLGEEHYGVYVIIGEVTDDEFAVRYISLPSADWGGKVAHHYLRFDREAGTFTQQAAWDGDKNIPPQHGRFWQRSNKEADPRIIRWETHSDQFLPPEKT